MIVWKSKSVSYLDEAGGKFACFYVFPAHSPELLSSLATLTLHHITVTISEPHDHRSQNAKIFYCFIVCLGIKCRGEYSNKKRRMEYFISVKTTQYMR